MERRITNLISIIVLTGFLLAGCKRGRIGESPLSPLSSLETPAPAATSAMISTPVPSPTWTPWPTSTPPSVPTFPPEAMQPEGWPLLPADLYFIRDGGLWRWPQAGGSLEQVVAAPQKNGSSGGKLSQTVGVTAYRLTADRQHLAFAFVELGPTTSELHSKLIVLNRTTGISVTIPTATDFYFLPPRHPPLDITPDGRYVIYFAQGVRPTTSSRAPGLTHSATMPQLAVCRRESFGSS